MARNFDVVTSSRASVAEVREVFSSREYWLARLQNYGGDSMTLEALTVDDDGTIEIANTQDLRRGALPGAIAKALPSNFVLHRREIWRPVDATRLVGDIRVDASGVRGWATGDASVTAAGPDESAGSTLRFTGSVEVAVPVIGGQIEKFIAAEIAREIPGVSSYTDEWIAKNA